MFLNASEACWGIKSSHYRLHPVDQPSAGTPPPGWDRSVAERASQTQQTECGEKKKKKVVLFDDKLTSTLQELKLEEV